MTENILAQVTPGATSLTDAYTVPSNKKATITKIAVCNRGGASTFRVALAVGGATDATNQYLYYDVPALATNTFLWEGIIDLNSRDVIRIYVGAATITFMVFGVET